MELDFSGLWSWAVPLWSLFVLVLFLGGVLLSPTVLEGMPVMTGGSRKTEKGRHVRWASDVKIALI